MSDFKHNDVIVLLGAGASVEAGIPHSTEMIREIEESIRKGDRGWSKFESLYHYVRSAIYYAEGIHGIFNEDVSYNIEKLVNILNEISKRNQHALYPFVGAWNPALVEVAGTEFSLVEQFRQAILEILIKEWLTVTNYEMKASYFEGLLDLQKSLKHPLRVFTLNYDLCLEKCAKRSQRILELGFDECRKWDWRLFDHNPEDPKDIYLYKLHGSTDWTYENDHLTYYDDIGLINQHAIIFGTYQKLEYRDPFLFLTYEFRRWTLESRIIVVIGYGFADEHINMIIRQALADKPDRTLVAVGPSSGISETSDRVKEIATAVDYSNTDQIKVSLSNASKFMSDYNHKDKLKSFLPPEDLSLFEDID